jgi:hypothetical protein
MKFFIEACFRMAIEYFDGKTSDLLKMLERQDAKKERHSIPVTVRLAPEVYEGLQRLHTRTGSAAASLPETPLISASVTVDILGVIQSTHAGTDVVCGRLTYLVDLPRVPCDADV